MIVQRPNGTGAAKTGGNYAASMLPGEEAHKQNFSDCIYLDPETHTKIEEVGSANFLGSLQTIVLSHQNHLLFYQVSQNIHYFI